MIFRFDRSALSVHEQQNAELYVIKYIQEKIFRHNWVCN